MTTQMLIRIDPETKEKLAQLARMEGKGTNQLVRDVIEEYVEDHDIGAYIKAQFIISGGNHILSLGRYENIEILSPHQDLKKYGRE